MEPPRLHLRLSYPEMNFGPGKADLLALIAETGSISAAGRGMNMSYKRAWSLVTEMNSAFAEPLVERVRGGAGGGGARLTPTGAKVLAHYKALIALVEAKGRVEIDGITGALGDMSGRK